MGNVVIKYVMNSTWLRIVLKSTVYKPKDKTIEPGLGLVVGFILIRSIRTKIWV